MAAQYIAFSRGDLDKVRNTYQNLLQDSRTEGMGKKQLVRLATRMALRPDSIDVPKPVKARAAKKKVPIEKKEEAVEESKGEEAIVGVEGEGVLDEVAKVGKKVLAWIAPKDASAAVKRIMAKYGDEVITKLRIARQPIVPAIEKLLRLFAGKKIKAEYKTIFHMFMLPTLKSGMVLRTERNQTFEMAEASAADKNLKEGEYIDVAIPAGITLRQAFDAFVRLAIERNPQMGAFRYAAMSSGEVKSNNCQDLVISWLQGMKALTPAIEKWVKQDIDNLLNKVANSIQQGVTDLAGAVGTHILGKGTERKLHTIDSGFTEVEDE